MTERQQQQGGFTILELLISIAIVSFMMMIAWSAFAQIGDSRKHMEVVRRDNREIRIAMTRMATDLSMAYLSANETNDALEARTFFIAKRSGEYPLRFSSLAHRVLWSNANESEQTMITYGLAPDPFERSTTNLVRRESRRMTDEGWDQVIYEADILVHDVEKVEFEYWNWRDKEWQPEWDSTQESERGRLPSRVRIKLTVRRKRGGEYKEIVRTTQARLMMEERLNFFN